MSHNSSGLVRNITEMKWFVIILAVKLVSTDKLDRKYLPPPGAKHSGGTAEDLQTPLVYPSNNLKEIHGENGVPDTENLQQNFKESLVSGMYETEDFNNVPATLPAAYLPSTEFNEFNQTTLFPEISYKTTSTLSPVLTDRPFNNPKAQSTPVTYSFNVKQSGSQQIDIGLSPTLSTPLVTSTVDFNYTISNNGSPAEYIYRSQIKSNNLDEYPHQIKFDSSRENFQESPRVNVDINSKNFGPGLGQYSVPQSFSDIATNYQPGTFGYYGGNPMIMLSQNTLQNFDNTQPTLITKNQDTSMPSFISSQKEHLHSAATTSDTPINNPYSQNILRSKIYKNQPSAQTIPNLSQSSSSLAPRFGQEHTLPIDFQTRLERPQSESDKKAKILNYKNEITPDGFSYVFDTSNGIYVHQGGTGTDGVKMLGSYSYIGDDGKAYKVEYSADKNGFQPRGDHLPTPPPIPEAIKKVIGQAYKNKADGLIDDGSYDEGKYGHMNYPGALGFYRPSPRKQIKNKNQNQHDKLFTNAKLKPDQSSQNGVQQPRGQNGAPYGYPNITAADQKHRINEIYNSQLDQMDIEDGGNNDNSIPKLKQIPQFTQRRRPSNIEYQNMNIDDKSYSKVPVSLLNENRYNNGLLHSKVFPDSEKPDSEITYQELYNNETLLIPRIPQKQVMNNQIINLQPQYVQPLANDVNQDTGYQYIPPINKFNQGEYSNRQLLTTVIPDTLTANSGTNNLNTPNLATNQIGNARGLIDSEIFATKSSYPSTTSANFVSQPNFETDVREISKTNQISEKQAQVSKEMIPARMTTVETTRRPHIPTFAVGSHNDQDEEKFNNPHMNNVTPEQNSNDLHSPIFIDDRDTTSYILSTTPMPGETITYNNQPTHDHSGREHHSENSPTSFQNTDLSTELSRERFKERISQNYPTSSTYVPSFTGSVSRLSPTIRVDGFGRPLPTDIDQGYLNRGVTFDNQISTTTVPESYEEPLFNGYPDDSQLHLQDKFDQEDVYDNMYGNKIYDSKITSKDSQNQENRGFAQNENTPIPEGVITSSSFTISGNFPPGNEEEAVLYNDGRPLPTNVIAGEDFSGPYQPQRYDPETGYHY